MDLFVYGTLLSPDLMAAVAGGGPFRHTKAALPDYAVCPVQGNVVPFIVPAQGAFAQGALWHDLTPDQMTRLDAYEGAFGYRLIATIVFVNGQPTQCDCYLPPDDMVPGAGEWSLDVWQREHLTPAVYAATELFSLNPLPDHSTLRRMWPMIESRAWSKHRAVAGPVTVRTDATSSDLEIVTVHPPDGSFYRLQALDITHRRFDGTRSDVLNREAFMGVDAALVLPFDPAHGRIALVEQVRMGPAARRDPNPWMLEPIAGIVDARETPQDAAIREAQEEAGLRISHLEPAGNYYASPGSSTDYFHSFVGLCDLPMTDSYHGGLADEAEDIRIHLMSVEDAMALAQSGEIATGPLLHLLYWLAFHRDRLSSMVS